MARIRSIKPEFWKLDKEPWGHSRTLLYVIQEHLGPVKIGITGHPVRRLSILQCGNHRVLWLRAVYEGTEGSCAEIEKLCHKFFASTNLKREWFSADLTEVLRFLDAFQEDAA